MSVKGGSVGFIETLTPNLATRYSIKSVSSVRSKPLRLMHMLWTILTHRKRIQVALIDTFSTQAFWFAYLNGRLCSFFNIPYIPIIRGGDFVNRINKSRNACDKLLHRSYLTIVPSKYLEHHLTSQGYTVRYIPNFIQLDLYPFKERNNLSANLLWVRAFHRIYDPVMAAKVLKELLTEFPSATLCMVGSDTDGTRKIVEEFAASNNLDGNLTMTGRLLKKEWIARSQESDVFINTTTIDNMPVSVIEAMALGMPIVSTDVGGVPFLIEDGKDGILVPAGDARRMVTVISELIKNPGKASSLSRNARRKAEGFAWDQVKQKWFEVLDQFDVIK